MKKILVPVDGTPRSLLAVEEVRTSFSPNAFEVILLMVKETSGYTELLDDDKSYVAELEARLDDAAEMLEGFKVTKRTAIGTPGNRIVECARDMGASMIVMTRSTRAGLNNTIGSAATYVIKHAACNVLIAREVRHGSVEAYRGMVYKKAEAVVNLRGQLSFKQSECLLPSVKGDTVYHITVTRGRVRFSHMSYNDVTREWDLPPANGQPESYDIIAGQTVAIPVNAESGNGKLDRIRVINRNVKTEAVFKYRITRP